MPGITNNERLLSIRPKQARSPLSHSWQVSSQSSWGENSIIGGFCHFSTVVAKSSCLNSLELFEFQGLPNKVPRLRFGNPISGLRSWTNVKLKSRFSMARQFVRDWISSTVEQVTFSVFNFSRSVKTSRFSTSQAWISRWSRLVQCWSNDKSLAQETLSGTFNSRHSSILKGAGWF